MALTKEKLEELVTELLAEKYQEYNGNIPEFLKWTAKAVLLTDAQLKSHLKTAYEAKLTKREADKAALESQKLNAEQQLTQAANSLSSVITELNK